MAQPVLSVVDTEAEKMARIVRKADQKQESQTSVAIPDRLYYRIGEVARICGVATSVLRFWETQFSQLRPAKGGTGQRLYRRREVEMALRIHQLVHVQGFTLAGARQALALPVSEALTVSVASAVMPAASPKAPTSPASHPLKQIEAELRELREMLMHDPAPPLRRKPRTTTHAAPTEPPMLFPDFEVDPGQ
jgi:DNA-binding transcriptional MerR regulator